MGKNISYFTTYKGENSLSNFLGLLLKILYKENPWLLEEFFSATLNGESNILIGPTFTQQDKSKKSIPDLSISQNSFSVFFETKLTDWFYDEQIVRHIESFSENVQSKILYLVSNFEFENYEDRFKDTIQIAKKNDIILQPLSFEDFVTVLEKIESSPNFKNILNEFREYLDENNLLPTWKYLLDVVNSGSTMNELNENVYMCPDTGGSYSHRRSKYLGAYTNKNVPLIFEIDNVVSVNRNCEDAEIRYINNIQNSEKSKETSINLVNKFRKEESSQWPILVFNLSKKTELSFEKDSKGGLLQSKKYFYDIAKNCNDINDLKNKLNNKKWSDFGF
ncbi:hypothetical protein EHQ58_10290 [Leptospira ognonensis]|uniref:PD-(D/E)XK nuclease superfamily protein n=1 Tax=Leptospira ognonensis TaxID=2484945 RepID=A0A4V3JR52_9LEPT|nr:hypothetical protein [Leptospira ognonensis]TGL58645.1 hypothetical protein EHQ58_10290 [Leptospira ognonensis]